MSENDDQQSTTQRYNRRLNKPENKRAGAREFGQFLSKQLIVDLLVDRQIIAALKWFKHM